MPIRQEAFPRGRPHTERTPEEGYHLSEDLAEKARRWIGQQRALVPTDRSYFAPGVRKVDFSTTIDEEP